MAPGGIRFAHPVWVQLLLLLGGLFASLGEKAPNRLEHNPTVAHRRGSPRCGNKPVLTLFNVCHSLEISRPTSGIPKRYRGVGGKCVYPKRSDERIPRKVHRILSGQKQDRQRI